MVKGKHAFATTSSNQTTANELLSYPALVAAILPASSAYFWSFRSDHFELQTFSAFVHFHTHLIHRVAD